MWSEEGCHEVAPFAVHEFDSTGAGDVFAAAFMVRVHETGDVMKSARFASAAAALVVQGPGLAAVADRAAIETLLLAQQEVKA